MRETTLDEIRNLVQLARPELERRAHAAGHENVKIYLHWTAGWYDHVFEDYHISIMGAFNPEDEDNGKLFISTEDFSDILQHTWLRNTGSIGVALCCGVGADTNDLGDCPPTAKQIEMMAKVVAALCDELDLPVDIYTVLTHGEAADNEDDDVEGYGEEKCYGPKNDCERWDLEYLGTEESPEYNPWDTSGRRGGDVIRGKANWYLDKGI